MATPDVTVLQVMNAAAALMNDVDKTVYTNAIQLPYVNMAMRELQEYFELNDIQTTTEFTSEPIDVEAGQEEITFAPAMPLPGVDYLPDDLVEPLLLWERQSGDGNLWTPMTKLQQLPRNWDVDGEQIGQLLNYVWQSNKIKFLPANQDNQIKMDYVKSLFIEFTETDGSDVLGVINSLSYMQYKTAALLARFVAENPTRSAELNGLAMVAMDRVIGIGAKNRQNIFIRRRPFRATYKNRTYT